MEIKRNKWVIENKKWVEYKSIKFMGASKKYMNLLRKASELPNTEIHFLINTLEDILDNKKYQRNEKIESEE